jgi:hypothetical protein
MTAPTVTIEQCAECRRPGATTTGVCLACAVDAIEGKPMKSTAGQAVQNSWHDMQARIRAKNAMRKIIPVEKKKPGPSARENKCSDDGARQYPHERGQIF